ncbi:MAG TPA: hypothetical protein VFU15_16670, partial [Bacteroidia bacterium]|nr:hypothetical protein [Bacteroidia bacterium]
TLGSLGTKQNLYLTKGGYAILQFNIQDDIFLQVYTPYDTLKYKFSDFERDTRLTDRAFMDDLFKLKITGTGREIVTIRNSERYINVANPQHIYPGIRVEYEWPGK